MDIVAVTLLRIGIFILVGIGLYISIRSLFDKDWAWRVHEFFAELKGIHPDSLYRSYAWEDMNTIGSLIGIGINVLMVILIIKGSI